MLPRGITPPKAFMLFQRPFAKIVTRADIFDPVGWFRPEDLPNSGEISTWLDSSGNARNLTQATSANRPVVLANALNGFRAASFDGVNDFLSGTVMPTFFNGSTREYSYFIVSRLKANPSGVQVFFHNGASSNGYFKAMTASRQRYLGHGGGAQDMIVTGSFIPVNTFEIANTQRETGAVNFRLNNVSFPVTNNTISFTNGTGSLWVGCFSGGTQLFANIDIVEIIFYQSLLSSTQRDNVYNYLRSKYNL